MKNSLTIKAKQSKATYCFNFDFITTIKKKYNYLCDKYSLTIWGDFWNNVPENLLLDDFSIDELQKLNFDGAYLACYQDFTRKECLVLRGHADVWPFFYCVEGNNIIFADDFYSLAKRFKTLTINKDSVADYFEVAWNNILKWDRTPFTEIHVLPAWTYMDSNFKIQSWKKLDTEIKFNEHNLEEFKKKFFECMDFYLQKIHEKGQKIAFSVSSGIDSNALAARYVQLYPDDDLKFYTSKIDDFTDESTLSVKMESVLHKPIILVNIKTNTFNYLELMKNHIDKNLPPSSNGVLNEGILCNELLKMNLNMTTVNGMGADGRFGEFGGEYLYLMHDFIKKLNLLKAYRIYKSVMVSFSDFNYKKDGDSVLLMNFTIMLAKNLIRKFVPISIHKRKNQYNKADSLLKISLPTCASQNIKNHKDSINYASQSGEVRDINIEFIKRGIKAIFPYVGYKFYQLSENCDPFIFSDRVNKSCERHAVSNLLPNEIINNVKKIANPAMSLSKALSANNNLEIIIKYIKNRKSILVNTEQLLENFKSQNYDQREFLALSLLIFEEKINQMGININL